MITEICFAAVAIAIVAGVTTCVCVCRYFESKEYVKQ